jgi:phage tail protein X
VLTPQQFAQAYGLTAAPAPAAPAPNPAFSYITQAGDRWDTIAWNFYGDPTEIAPLIAANPAVPLYPVFDAGIALMIPIIVQPADTSSDLPLWRQAS